jgi:hypothetical protein
MKNKIEGGGYLNRQEGGVAEGILLVMAAVGLVYLADTGFQRGARTAMNEPDFPQGTQEVYKSTASKFTFVYEGQQEPKCPGDIDKVVPIMNKAGELRGANVICKPATAEPTR